MIFGKTKMELKVGLFVFLGICVLAAFVLSIGKYKTWTSGYKVCFNFNFVNGVKIGAPVRFAGVDIGEIKKIDFIYIPQEQRYQIRLNSWVRNAVMIPKDSTIWVNTLGLLGEKYVEIMPGKDYANCLTEGEAINGEDPLPMQEVFRLAKGVVDNLDVAMKEFLHTLQDDTGTIGKLLHDDTVYKNLEEFTDDIKKHPWKLLIKGKEKK